MNQSDRIRDLIGQMVLKDSFWGYLFSRVGKIEDTKMDYAAGIGALNDGMLYLFYNPEKTATINDTDLEVVLSHEGIHILNKHVSRLIRILADETKEELKESKSKIWNYAADFNANEIIKAPDFITIDKERAFLYHAKNFKLELNKTTEYYYYKLLEQSEDQKGKGKDGKGDAFGHEKWTSALKGIPDLYSFSRRVEQFIKESVQQSMKSVRNKGNISGNLRELIDQCLLPPEIPYYQIIKKLVKGSRLAKDKLSYSKINRKRTYLFLTGDQKGIPQISPFPGKSKDMTFNIVILADTSGSMSKDDILESLKGVKSIIEKDKYCHTTVLQCDTSVKKEYTVKRIRDIDFTAYGRGGTHLSPGLFRAKELNSDVCLVFTDGYCENINIIPKKQLPKKIIWVLTPDGSKEYIDKTGYIVRIPK